jgi:hypothetical protein
MNPAHIVHLALALALGDFLSQIRQPNIRTVVLD